VEKNSYIEKLYKFTKELNFQAIEWGILYEKRAEEIRKIMDDYGLKTSCYTFFADINFDDENKQKEGIEKIKRGIKEVKILGTDKIMLPIRGKSEYTREKSRENVLRGIEKVIDFVKSYNITITVEHFF